MNLSSNKFDNRVEITMKKETFAQWRQVDTGGPGNVNNHLLPSLQIDQTMLVVQAECPAEALSSHQSLIQHQSHTSVKIGEVILKRIWNTALLCLPLLRYQSISRKPCILFIEHNLQNYPKATRSLSMPICSNLKSLSASAYFS